MARSTLGQGLRVRSWQTHGYGMGAAAAAAAGHPFFPAVSARFSLDFSARPACSLAQSNRGADAIRWRCCTAQHARGGNNTLRQHATTNKQRLRSHANTQQQARATTTNESAMK